MNEKLKSVQIANEIPNFGDECICYAQIGNDQIVYLDRLIVYVRAIGSALPISDEALYTCYLLYLAEVEKQTELLDSSEAAAK